MAKAKRISMDELLGAGIAAPEKHSNRKRSSAKSTMREGRTSAPEPPEKRPPIITSQPKSPRRPGVKQHTAYLPIPVHEQLRKIAFEENTRIHSLIMEGIELVFAKRGVKSYAELSGE